jgi:hypothetical protein
VITVVRSVRVPTVPQCTQPRFRVANAIMPIANNNAHWSQADLLRIRPWRSASGANAEEASLVDNTERRSADVQSVRDYRASMAAQT